MSKLKWKIIHESDDEDGNPTQWSTEINHPKYGKYCWINDMDGYFTVEVYYFYRGFVELARCKSFTSAKRWVDKCLNLVGEYNKELAAKIVELLPIYTDEEYYELEKELKKSDDYLRDAEDEVDRLQEQVDDLNEEIPKDELREYEDIIAPLKEDGKLLALSKLTQNYIKLLSKKRLYRGVDMKTYMRKKMLKGKEFIHSEGHWNDYLKYLRKEIPNA